MGGACAEPVVAREALNALRDGRPRLVGLYGEGGRVPRPHGGHPRLPHDVPQRRHAGDLRGAYLPTPALVLLGHGPVVATLATMAAPRDTTSSRSPTTRPEPVSTRSSGPRWWRPPTARYRSQVAGRITYFCCLGCKETLERDPQRYPSR